MNFLPRTHAFSLVITITIVTLLVQSLAPESIELLRYESSAVAQGEWWRIFSANFTHSGWNHWFLNITGLIIIDYLYQPCVTQLERVKLMAFCFIGNVLLLHLLHQIGWYVGLSGALHGYLIGCALLSLEKDKLYSSLILLGVSVKLIIEGNWEINQFTANLIGTNVLEEAHLYGGVCGLSYWLFCSAIDRINKKGA